VKLASHFHLVLRLRIRGALLLLLMRLHGVVLQLAEEELTFHTIQSDSKLLSGFPWPIILKSETTK
jgi:hypothetical protein